MLKIFIIILIFTIQVQVVSAQVQEVFLPGIDGMTEAGVRRRAPSAPSIGLNISGASENPNTNKARTIAIDPGLSEAIGYLAIGGALLALYKLLAGSFGIKNILKRDLIKSKTLNKTENKTEKQNADN